MSDLTKNSSAAQQTAQQAAQQAVQEVEEVTDESIITCPGADIDDSQIGRAHV